jgi:very-short-patch-repair endonuclease
MFKGAPASSFSKAESLRNNMTQAETILWEALKDNKLDGFKFRRQHPIHLYIADFYCHKLKLIIEIDGAYHNSKEQLLIDKQRTSDLELQGLKVLRFTNEEVENGLNDVLKRISQFSKENI